MTPARETLDFRVETDGLNLRSEPSARRRSSILAVLPRGHAVRKVGEAAEGWWSVTTDLGGRSARGFVASRFLSTASESEDPPSHQGRVPQVHMPGGKGRRNLEGARAYPLGEAPPRDGRSDAAWLRRVVDYLSVQTSARYQPRQGTTFCNIYAYDFCYLAGSYLPRVWWSDRAISDLASGGRVPVSYGATVHELNANALYEWLLDWGADFGWVRTVSLSDLQEAANSGRVSVICARRKDRNRSGHIAAVVPETRAFKASRRDAGVVSPVQSQAGASNHEYWVSEKAWWTGAQFDSFGFWFREEGAPDR